MDTTDIQCRVRQCSKCPRDTEYYCASCPCELCGQCKENHVQDLKTIDHNVIVYFGKYDNITNQEIYARVPSNVNGKWCELCDLYDCSYCVKQNKHITIYTRNISEQKHQRKLINIIRSETLLSTSVLLVFIKDDIKKSISEFSLLRTQMLTKHRRMMDLVKNVLRHFNYKHRCTKQHKVLARYLDSILEYEHNFDHSAVRPVQFLKMKSHFPKVHDIPHLVHHCQLSMTISINKKDVGESMRVIEIADRGKRRVKIEPRLKLMPVPELHQSLKVKGVDGGHHISCMTSDRAWVSDDKTHLTLTKTTSDTLHQLKDLCDGDKTMSNGLHTVNNERELIYIDSNRNIVKLSTDMITTTVLVKRKSIKWKPLSLHYSLSTGDLLVGMYIRYSIKESSIKNRLAGKVMRYNQSGKLTQEIEYSKTKAKLFKYPHFIAENTNGDIVVSDYSSIVVTTGGGKYRFTYKRHPSGKAITPRGICTDALSHILLCDIRTCTVQILNSDGRFLSHLLIRPSGIFKPWGLSYDFSTHRLWVTTHENRNVCVYRYITRHDTLTDENMVNADIMESLNEIQITEAEIPQEENENLLRIMYPPEKVQSFTMPRINGCDHISIFTFDSVWINDGNNLFLTNYNGETLQYLGDLCPHLFSGSHTVSIENELTYIDMKYDIMKLSRNMKTSSTFIERTDSNWEPRCLHCSLSTGDLIVGMHSKNTDSGKVIRYNREGQPIGTIHLDNTGLELYKKPNFITENNNGDVVVSDSWSAVVVTEGGGGYRFTYTGHPAASNLSPHGICTDALSHILVCDYASATVHMLDKNGHFVSHIVSVTQESHIVSVTEEMFRPHSLSYDINTHHLWVGSELNKNVCVYRYISIQDPITDEDQHFTDEEAMPVTSC